MQISHQLFWKIALSNSQVREVALGTDVQDKNNNSHFRQQQKQLLIHCHDTKIFFLTNHNEINNFYK